MLQQLCDDSSDFVLLENNGVAPEWSYNPFLIDTVVFNKNRIASVIAALTLTFGVYGPISRNTAILASNFKIFRYTFTAKDQAREDAGGGTEDCAVADPLQTRCIGRRRTDDHRPIRQIGPRFICHERTFPRTA